MALLTTFTSPKPAAWIFLRSTEAPIAEEPMPASQANTMVFTGPARVAVPVPPRRPARASEPLPLLASVWLIAASKRSYLPPQRRDPRSAMPAG